MAVRRLFFFALLSGIIIGCRNNPGDSAVVSGTVEVPGMTEIRFLPLETYYEDPESVIRVAVDEKGRFRIEYALQEPLVCAFLGSEIHFVYLEPGTELEVVFPENGGLEILRDTRNNNTIFSGYMKSFPAVDYGLGPDDFTHTIDSLYRRKVDFIEKNSEKITGLLKEYLLTSAFYETAGGKIYYARRYAEHLLKGQNEFFSFLDSVPVNNEAAARNRNYHEFIEHYINYRYRLKAFGQGVRYINDYAEKYVIAREELQGQALEQFLTVNFNDGIGSALPQRDILFDQLREFLADPEFSDRSKSFLNNLLSSWESRTLAPGNPAPGFSLNATDGQTHALSDFRGKYVILDFWASWCGPCISGFPETMEIARKYEGKAVLLTINYLEKNDVWLEAVKKYQLPAPSLSLDKETAVEYGMNGSISLPYYVLIDPDGKIALDRTTPEVIEEYLFSDNKK